MSFTCSWRLRRLLFSHRPDDDDSSDLLEEDGMLDSPLLSTLPSPFVSRAGRRRNLIGFGFDVLMCNSENSGISMASSNSLLLDDLELTVPLHISSDLYLSLILSFGTMAFSETMGSNTNKEQAL